jgi:nucleoside-diphosphate-sugar epimerase
MTTDSCRFLVTGATGCIGAWTVRLLLDDGIPVVAAHLKSDFRRFHLVSLGRGEDVEFVQLDVTDAAAVTQVVQEHEITHIVHLAGLQTPFCAADPPLGAMVNVVGTVNVFEAVRASGRPIGLAYASSSAVYGNITSQPAGLVTDSSPLHPETLYGVYKAANEGTATIYAATHGIGSIGLRPFSVYGPGRDQGMTSDPTKAVLAAVLNTPFKINFGGNLVLTYAADCARAFTASALAAAGSGDAVCLSIPGRRVGMPHFIDMITSLLPEAKGRLSCENKPIPIPSLLGATALEEAVGEIPNRTLPQGIADTIEHFRRALAAGLLSPPPSIGA